MGQDLAMQVLTKGAGEPEGSSSIFQGTRDWCRSPSRALVLGLTRSCASGPLPRTMGLS